MGNQTNYSNSKHSRKDRWDKLSIIVKAISGIIMGITIALIGYFLSARMEIGSTDGRPIAIPLKDAFQEEIKGLSDEIDKLKVQLKSIAEIPKDNPLAPKIALIESDLSKLKNDLDNLNYVIIDSPNKALQIPLLKKDMDSMKKEIILRFSSLEKSINKSYDIVKWVIGTILLSILGLAVSILLQQRKN
jgi:hypothetical protein